MDPAAGYKSPKGGGKWGFCQVWGADLVFKGAEQACVGHGEGRADAWGMEDRPRCVPRALGVWIWFFGFFFL